MSKSLKYFLSCVAIFCGFGAYAQPTNERGWYDSKDLEHVSVGWLETIQYTQPSKAVTRNGRTYNTIQTGFIQKTVTDWQKTYIPKGLLGVMKQSILAPDPPLPPTNGSYDFIEAEKESKRALPNSYGAFAAIHKCLVKTKAHKFFPMPGNHCDVKWNVMANNIELISSPMVYLSSADEYYFLQPRYMAGMKGQFEKEWLTENSNYRNFTNSPNLKKFDHYMRPDISLYVVVITKDGKPLPFDQVTMGEFLDRLETQLPRMYQISTNMKVKAENLLPNAKRGIQVLRNMFRNQLNQPVYINDLNKNIDCLTLAGIEEGKDIPWISTELLSKRKSGWIETGFPLLRLRKGVKEICATSGPQWIVCTLEGVIDESFGGSIDLMDNFVSRFNYNHLHDYYFSNKTTEAYQAVAFVSNDVKNNSQAATPLSGQAKKMAADKSTVFFEDFSTVADKATPPNWNTQTTRTGDGIGIVEINGEKWLRLKRNASPKNLSLNMAEDFEFSVDVLVRKGDVPWGTPGVEIEMPFSTAGGDKILRTIITPGDMNRKDAAGWVTISFSGGNCNFGNYHSLTDFKGSAEINRCTVTVRRKGTTLTFLCNNIKVYECTSAFTPEMRLKGFRFDVNEKNAYHLTNITLKKL